MLEFRSEVVEAAKMRQAEAAEKEAQEKKTANEIRLAILYLDQRNDIHEYIDRALKSIRHFLKLNPEPTYEDWMTFIDHIITDFKCDTIKPEIIRKYILERIFKHFSI